MGGSRVVPKFDVQLKKGTHFASSSWPCAYSSRARAAQSHEEIISSGHAVTATEQYVVVAFESRARAGG